MALDDEIAALKRHRQEAQATEEQRAAEDAQWLAEGRREFPRMMRELRDYLVAHKVRPRMVRVENISPGQLLPPTGWRFPGPGYSDQPSVLLPSAELRTPWVKHGRYGHASSFKFGPAVIGPRSPKRWSQNGEILYRDGAFYTTDSRHGDYINLSLAWKKRVADLTS